MKRMSEDRMMKIIDEAWSDYEGDCSVLMSAVGALVLGREIGWKGLRVCMSSSTYRKYERILKITFRDELPDRTKASRRLRGIRMADSFGKFWQALSGGMIPASEGKIAEPAT